MKKDQEIITVETSSVENIKQLPMFYLSLASKELFHSNFIFWISTLKPHGNNTIRRLFGISDLSKLVREKNGNKIDGKSKKLTPKADIVGYNSQDEIVLVIENKVKDIPNEEQMSSLKKSFGDNIKYVILSFIEPCFKIRPPVYFISYKALKKTLNQDIELYNHNNYHYQLLKDYIQLITYQQNIINSYNLSGHYDFALNSRKALMLVLNDVKLWENYQRVAGQNFGKKVLDNIKPLNGFEKLQTTSSVNHQKATVDFYFQWDFFKIGIQIENNQYRRFIFGEISKINADNLRTQSLWFSNDWRPKRKLKKLNFKEEAEAENEDVKYSYYGSYNMSKKGLSLYQYEPKFTKNCSKSFNEMCSMIKNDLQILLEIGIKEKIELIMSNKNNN